MAKSGALDDLSTAAQRQRLLSFAGEPPDMDGQPGSATEDTIPQNRTQSMHHAVFTAFPHRFVEPYSSQSPGSQLVQKVSIVVSTTPDDWRTPLSPVPHFELGPSAQAAGAGEAAAPPGDALSTPPFILELSQAAVNYTEAKLLVLVGLCRADTWLRETMPARVTSVEGTISMLGELYAINIDKSFVSLYYHTHIALSTEDDRQFWIQRLQPAHILPNAHLTYLKVLHKNWACVPRDCTSRFQRICEMLARDHEWSKEGGIWKRATEWIMSRSDMGQFARCSTNCALLLRRM